MPDITMCRGTSCPLRDDCYRFTTKPDGMQSFFATPPYDTSAKTCRNQLRLKKTETTT